MDKVIKVFFPEVNYSESRTLYILDVNGKKVFEQPFRTQNMKINSADFPNGYYVVNISDRGNITSSRIVVSHR